MKLFRFCCAIINDTTASLFTDSQQNDRDADMLLRRIDLENDIRENLESVGWRQCLLSSKYNILIPEYDLDDLRDWWNLRNVTFTILFTSFISFQIPVEYQSG